ncbi:probable methyltransferase-like protein 24 [Lepeophtheirus salmonis]|uniref:probable methyltransferase-like protein 24 n=1 Tax=Lepeophtheirus salmonis TaxID=72036 RepID=UPI001AE1A638|nr:methyltransferase-like protein 24 [Lepeophtheirus salmonis]
MWYGRYSLFLFSLLFYHSISLDSLEKCNQNKDTKVGKNPLASLFRQDQEREAYLLEQVGFNFQSAIDGKRLKSRFYRAVASPLQTYCQVSSLFGGKWLGNCGALDGSKYICMDKFLPAVDNGTCLVYSFGIGDDWSFEDLLAESNCKVHAYDPTIESPSKRSKNIYFYKIGLAVKSGKSVIKNNLKNNAELKTKNKSLKDILSSNNDLSTIITYMKVDVEGSELKAFPTWVSSGILKNVQQLGIEFHLGLATLETDGKVISHILELLKSIQELHKQGFRLVSYSPNECVGKTQDKEQRYYAYFDVVFVNLNV